MEGLLAALADTPPAVWMRFSRWGYAAVNAAHVLGVALLVGAILPLDLRLLGLWRRHAVEPLAGVLTPVAATGLVLASLSGSLLFLTDPVDYTRLRLFLVKIGLIVAGTLHALWWQFGSAAGLSADPARLRLVGGFSLCVWLGALCCGRMLAFV